MKNLLFIGLLICSLSSKGQSFDTSFLHGLTAADSGKIHLGILNNYGAEMKDTIPVILLVIDTAAHGSNSFKTTNPIAYWIKGYAERTLVYGNVPCTTNGSITYYINCMGWTPILETYLDADKKPLSKNIIVWMSKELQ